MASSRKDVFAVTGDDRAVVGASGKPQEPMQLGAGAKGVAKAIGHSDAPSRLSNGQFTSPRRGMRFRF